MSLRDVLLPPSHQPSLCSDAERSLINVQEINSDDSRGKHNRAISGGAQHYQQINWRESKSPWSITIRSTFSVPPRRIKMHRGVTKCEPQSKAL